ncbi:YceH family protein [Solimonas terrae]|uniref:DUF480 domain-containing protein n=1 Tax=Solimonas terrae TaxID=1396819 RepID=A0A6M2BW70_9GAMM|nr:DUF480 domain-containing protein [Solimonas terrae]NGY06515.1 DUF480 domain-containing protein [Solimonas terrae]
MSELLLSPVEARVVAVLVEKSITTPAYYPMTVNAIMLAANQKTSRSPVMNLGEGEIGNALNALEERKLVARDSFSGRAQKWRQQFMHQMLLKPQTQALLVTLLLRGPQTLSELRGNAAVLGGPGDDEALRVALDDLADRAQPLVTALARAPGQSAQRWAPLLCGAEALSTAEPEVLAASPARSEDAGRVAQLEARVSTLEARLAALESQLGIGGGDAA